MPTQCQGRRAPDRLGMARFLTTQDLTKDYKQIPLSLESKVKMAFSTLYGLYQFVMILLGLFCPLATFQHLMDRVLRPAGERGVERAQESSTR